MTKNQAANRSFSESEVPPPFKNDVLHEKPTSPTSTERWVYGLRTPLKTPSINPRHLFGGKGQGLREMAEMKLPVPSALFITTRLCNWFYAHKKTFPESFEAQLFEALESLEKDMGLKLGDAENPLLISVRSGARASMPGMMDTILNLGLNEITVKALAHKTSDERFAYDSYRRFIQMYSNVVLDLNLSHFEKILEQYKKVRRVREDSDLEAADLKTIVARFKAYVKKMTGEPFPEKTHTQLLRAVEAVLRSWMNKRAVAYRSLYHIPETWGTGVIIQAMVFGNLGNNSATGVAFTRNPATGEKVFFGEYLPKAQGEDVVAGIRTPHPLTLHQKELNLHRPTKNSAAQKPKAPHQALEEAMPKAYKELCSIKDTLEKHYKDMQDIEFTIQEGRLWILQTRSGKRTAAASMKISIDMVNEGLITQEEALLRFDPLSLDQLLHPQLENRSDLTLLGQGLPASPGSAVGRVALTSEECIRLKEQGEPAILVRDETSADDIEGMASAKGILTACGGMTSHAAVVARGMGKTCIVGTQGLYLTPPHLSLGGTRLMEGDFLTLDGEKGDIFKGRGRLSPPKLTSTYHTFMRWADGARRLEVRANADTPEDVDKAFSMGAEGIGLCRTEHMFFEARRTLAIRRMILATTPEARSDALADMFPMQRDDFIAMLKAVKGRPLTVRLLDPPLHEFLPQGGAEIDQLAQALHIQPHKVRARLLELKEANPMLGNRGCRLGLTMPEVYDMQVSALITAAQEAQKEGDVQIELMLPLISLAGELRVLKKRIQTHIAQLTEKDPLHTPFKIGTMIELPRAALKADKIAMEADFISFGTNDLTQTTFGFSRDDVGSFLGIYRRKGILLRDPFTSLDQSGVGELIKIAMEKARTVKPQMKFGICGEQGADPTSIAFFEHLGLHYVSCSPYRIPIARLAAAKAHLNTRAH